MSEGTTIVVTAMGGNVGQGVVRLLRTLAPEFRVLGTNTVGVSGGNHLCDELRQVPFASDPAYREAILSLVETERPALIVPCTDHETVALAALVDHLPPLGVSPLETSLTFFDKWKTFERFSRAGLPFANSRLPSNLDGSLASVVVKPREGRGSRDVHYDPPFLDRFDDTFIVQERLHGEELTIAAYVTQEGRLHGFIVLKRALQTGATIACETAAGYEEPVSRLLEGILSALPIRGSFNVQAMACADGSIVPFEVNGRISGTASIRHHFGFRDVDYLLREYVWKSPLPKVEITPGSAVRYLTDVIYPGLPLAAERSRKTPHFLF